MFSIGNKLYSFIALLFVFLTLVGYPIVTSLFLPVFSEEEAISQSVTFPFRAVVLLIAFFLIVTKPATRYTVPHRFWPSLFIGFILVYTLRILLDLYVFNVYVVPNYRVRVIQNLFLSVLPSLWAISKCAYYIDYERLNKWLVYASIILLVILSINQRSLFLVEFNEEGRMTGNVGLGSISLGQLGVTIFTIAAAWMMTRRTSFIVKIILSLVLFFSFVIMLRAASRGPLITFFVIIIMIFISRTKNKARGLALLFIVFAVLWLNYESILHFLGQISPVMESRMFSTVNEGDTSFRNIQYANAYHLFLSNPILGAQFVTDFGLYSHNSVLDVMMGLGLIGAIVWVALIIKCFIITYQNCLSLSCITAICLLSVQNIVSGFFSGALYTNQIQIILIAMVLLLQSESNTQLHQSYIE